MKTVSAIVLGLIIVGGGAYFFLHNGNYGTMYQAGNNQGPSATKDQGNGKSSFKSIQLGFSLEYPSSDKELTLNTTVGKIDVNGSIESAPATKEYSLYNFVTADGRSMFYVVGSKFSLFTEGLPVEKLLKDCVTKSNGCVKKHNANNVEYYYLDNYSYVVGEMHVALVPLQESTLVISIQRTDSSEEASTAAEEQAYFELVDSVRLLP
jgi:hypothetical protein